MKLSMMAMTSFEESPRTHEDSCSISTSLAIKMSSKTTKVKSYVVSFTQELHDVAKPGDILDPDTVLMSIEDEGTVGTGMFDAESSALLGKLSRMNPRSSYSGVLDKIEVLYNGDKSEMPPSLKTLANRSDKLLIEASEAAGKPVVNGRVTGDYRVAGKNLLPNHAEVKFYITVTNPMGVGDKGVVANQLKTVVGEVFSKGIHTESGEPVDVIFGGRSAINRIVNSYAIEGTTTRLLMMMDRKIPEIYGLK